MLYYDRGYFISYVFVMNKFFSWLGKKAANGIVTGVFFLITIVGITYAISYPSAPPAGETAGGKFSRLFQVCPAGKMLRGFNVDTGIDCIDPPVGPK